MLRISWVEGKPEKGIYYQYILSFGLEGWRIPRSLDFPSEELPGLIRLCVASIRFDLQQSPPRLTSLAFQPRRSARASNPQPIGGRSGRVWADIVLDRIGSSLIGPFLSIS